MSGIPCYFACGDGYSAFGGGLQYWTRIGTYLKLASLPSADTTLVDLDGGSVAYLRLKCTAAGHVVAEGSFHGAPCTLDLTPTTALSLGSWYWCAAIMGDYYNSLNYGLIGQVSGPAGASDGPQRVNTAASRQGNQVNCLLGWGVTRSSGYANFVYQSGQELSKLVIDTNTDPPHNNWIEDYGLRPTPTSDGQLTTIYPGWPLDNIIQGVYLCRDTVGSSLCSDSSGHGYDLTPGPQGLTIMADGPYA